MTGLVYRERPADGEAAGLLVLHHGRGADEYDLLGLADVLDPRRRLHVVSPRAPLRLPGWPGHHWYRVPRVGYPDPESFGDSAARLGAFHDEQWARTGLTPGQTVLAGFSMGTVMSYALGLDADRPAPAGIMAFSGFVPTVPGWAPSLTDRGALRAFIAHGRRDPVIDVEFARRAAELLRAERLEVSHRESDVGHQIDPAGLPVAAGWLTATLGLALPI
jgi:phospholipase/carboxylesterase